MHLEIFIIIADNSDTDKSDSDKDEENPDFLDLKSSNADISKIIDWIP